MRGAFRQWGAAGDVAPFELAVSELVTNAMVHGTGEITVTVSLTGDVVRLDVIDAGDGTGPGSPHDPGADGMGGWGLKIVDVLSEDWGARREADGTHVWMRRRLRGRP